ncbi:hypothetical protein Q9R35_03355 [Alcaligenes sp. AB3]|uniref:hypothetical protein n=1 Tax=Alcaligenes sp. AB3 TaxID=2962569 RepID=UPI0028818F93|nr:hypothetical protein [Alcaligenes sp. AB3]MDT0216349.1 hypothetical protein [Alcaligenes sp. AB3]
MAGSLSGCHEQPGKIGQPVSSRKTPQPGAFLPESGQPDHAETNQVRKRSPHLAQARISLLLSGALLSWDGLATKKEYLSSGWEES